MIHGRTAATGSGRQREQRPGLQVRRRTRVRLASAALMLTAAVGATRADNVVGAWDSPAANNWPLIAVHAALTPDGRVLTYGTWSVINGTNNPAQQTGYFKYDIWNPAAGLSGGHLTLDSARESDLFCSSQVILPDSGSVFIAGGDNWTGTGTTNTGNNNSNIFRPSDNTLYREVITSGPPPVYKNMNRARWYSSSTVLANGEIYIQGGNGGGDRPEVRDSNGNFRLLSNVNTSSLAATFPRNFLAPDGRIFGYDTNGNMYYVNAAGTGQTDDSWAVHVVVCGMDLERSDVSAGKDPADGRQLEWLGKDRHHRPAARRHTGKPADVFQAAVGFGHRTRRWPRAGDGWQQPGQHSQ